MLAIQFLEANVTIDTSLLPASPLEVYTLTQATPSTLQSDAPGGAALPPGCSAQGICIHVTAAGALCNHLDIGDARDGLLVGSFSIAPDTATSNAASGLFAWAATCDNCTFSPTSGLVLRLDASCQALRIVVSAVGALGSVDFAVFTSPQPASGLAPISGLRIISALTLTTYEDTRYSNPVMRGYLLGSSSIDAAFTALAEGAPAVVDIDVSLPLAGSYSAVTVSQVTSAVQLLSSIAGLLGLIGTVGSVYALAMAYLPHAVVEGPPQGEAAVSKSKGPRRILRWKAADGPSAASTASNDSGTGMGSPELALEMRQPPPTQSPFTIAFGALHGSSSSSSSVNNSGGGSSLGNGTGNVAGTGGSERTPLLLQAHS